MKKVRFDKILGMQNVRLIGNPTAYLFRRLAYNPRTGIVSNRDEKLIMKIYDDLIEQIRKYSILVIERLLREGRISKKS
ncbi:hypothetical protein HYX05_00245 [Candidatus Woesearchaeota archaeon]|nr:hypothetical protein [Candidatus Woesearchaeota archaeon]